MIELKDITKKYDNKLVLNSFNATFKRGTINIVYGPSGCGKTTLFNIISGLDRDYSGEITGVPEQISYLFQEDRLLPYHTVIDNVLFTMPDTISKKEKLSIAEQCLAKMELSDSKCDFPYQLSGGMARRAAIARALCYPCDLLILDEPFNGLNSELKSSVVDTLKDSIAGNKKCVIVITHDLSPFDDENNINIVKMKNI
jgi:NitT/TauT family transport system ATP-binding protein